MKNLYVITFKKAYGDAQVLNVVASTSDTAIERGRIELWKQFKYYKKSEWDVIELVKSETKVAV